MNVAQSLGYDATTGAHRFDAESFRVGFLPNIRIGHLIGVEPEPGTKLERVLMWLRKHPKERTTGLEVGKAVKIQSATARVLLHELWKREMLNRSGPHNGRQQYRYWAK